MTERHDRLRIAFKRTGLTQKQACERWGWVASTFKGNLNGSASFRFERAKEYARAFGVRVEWLYEGEGPMLPVRTSKRQPVTMPMISWVAAGQLADTRMIDPDPDQESVTISGLPGGEYFATDVRGDSMDRISPEGSLLVVNIADRELVRGKPYLFSHDGKTTFKLWEPTPVPRLEPYSTNPSHKPIFLTTENWSVIGRVYRTILNLV